MSFRSRPRFLCDVDDVLANYVQGFVAAVLATGVRDIKMDHPFDDWDLSKSLGLTEEEDNKVYSLINMPGFATRLNPMPGAVEAVKKIAQIADVLFVTSPLKSSPTWAFDRTAWLQKHFGTEQGNKVASTGEKYAVSGDFLLDDKPEHCAEWHTENPLGLAMLWSTGRNLTKPPPYGVAVVGNWPMVYALVEAKADLMTAQRAVMEAAK